MKPIQEFLQSLNVVPEITNQQKIENIMKGLDSNGEIIKDQDGNPVEQTTAKKIEALKALNDSGIPDSKSSSPRTIDS